MLDLELDHRAKQVERDAAAGRKPGRDYTASMHVYREFLDTGTCKEFPGEARKLFIILRGDSVQESLAESLLFSKYPFGCGECEEALGIPEVVLKWYGELFFDMACFEMRSQQISYVRRLPCRTPEEREHRETMLRVLDAGYRYVLEHNGGRDFVVGSDGGEATVSGWADYAVLHGTYAVHKALNNHYAAATSEMNREARSDFREMRTAHEYYVEAHPQKQDAGISYPDLVFSDEPEELSSTARPRTQEINDEEFV